MLRLSIFSIYFKTLLGKLLLLPSAHILPLDLKLKGRLYASNPLMQVLGNVPGKPSPHTKIMPVVDCPGSTSLLKFAAILTVCS